MADTEVPDGTAAEVLDWVGDDPQRAQTALEAENCKDQPRSTLTSKLEAIAAKEAPVSTDQTDQTSYEPPADDTTATGEEGAGGTGTVTTDRPVSDEQAEAQDEARAEQEELAPEQPEVVEIYAEDAGTVVYGVSVRDPDVEVPEDAIITADPELDKTPEAVAARSRTNLDDSDAEPISAEPVEFITAASGTYGLVLNLNGTVFGFNSQQVGQLKQVVDKTVVGLAL